MRADEATAASIASLDRALLRRLDATLRTGERRAAGHLRCRLGCTSCCVGVFDITALDAARLQRALRGLHRRRPDLAASIVRRARRHWRMLAALFPGDRAGGTLVGDERARHRLFVRFAELPCALLEPRSGACLLYRSRPLSCRTFGLPIRCGDLILPPCRLNFRAASQAAVRACAVEPDPLDVEGALIERLAREEGKRGDTVVAAAIALGC